MVPSLAQRVIELNNKSIADMRNGRHEFAIKTLQHALSLVVKLPEQPLTAASSDDTYNDYFCCSVPLTPPSLNKVGSSSSHCNDVFDFFNRAIVLPELYDDDNDKDCFLLRPQHRSRVQAVLLFNIGAFYHVHGVEFGDTAALTQALTFYGWAYYAIESTSKVFGFQDALLLLLSCFNNMGHIHSIFMNADKTRQCFQWMQSTFATPNIQHILQEADYTFFFQYISVTASRQLLLSPAA